jgi:copper chaperone
VDRAACPEHITREEIFMTKQTLDLKVEGMSCQHCVHAVKSAVSGLAGVDKVEVSLEKKLATVDFDPAITNLQLIRTAIEGEGYSVK